MKEAVETIFLIARSAWRFRRSALLVAFVVGALATLATLLIPGLYQSHAQIYVDSKSVLRPLLQGLAVNQAPNESDVVRRALLARPTLDQVARKTGLYARVTTPEGADKLLADLAKLIDIRGDSSTGLYTISYEDVDARKAQAVVQTLLETFVESSIGAGRADTQNAEAFLAQQVSEYERRLSQQEQRIADFKKKNIGLMPDQRGDYFARLQTEVAARDKLRTELAVATQQREELKRKLVADGSGGSVSLAPLPTNQQIQAAEALDARIREAQNTLDALLDKYTDQHPAVVAQKEVIRQLMAQRQARLGMVRPTNASRANNSPVAIDPVVQNLQIALNSADVQVAALRTQLDQAEASVSELQRTVTTGPEIEAELARLNRDYGVTKAEYEALLQRLESARISHDADRSEELRFKVLDPPHFPLRPIKPNRPLLLAGALLAALLSGAGMAVLRAQTQPVFFSKAKLAAALNLPVIGVVSRATPIETLAVRRRESILFGFAAAALVLAILAAAVFSSSASLALRHAIRGAGG